MIVPSSFLPLSYFLVFVPSTCVRYVTLRYTARHCVESWPFACLFLFFWRAGVFVAAVDMLVFCEVWEVNEMMKSCQMGKEGGEGGNSFARA